jgi:hypothetical protein
MLVKVEIKVKDKLKVKKKGKRKIPKTWGIYNGGQYKRNSR